ncbi:MULTISPECIES: HNH endonuclease family protein [unclassified Streptomyces]|uniref:HNH endonuclease family protein n=1 Tax=unclassified Streptomyces TaxID=2593676 RepID=UPI0031BAB8AE
MRETLTRPRGLGIDHMVPLAEAWDSGASAWSVKRRQAFANDLGDERSLVAVTARSNRSKADQDPAQWQPPLADARCTYTADWVATKLRGNLAVDKAERQALRQLAAVCGQETVEYEPAPAD